MRLRPLLLAGLLLSICSLAHAEEHGGGHDAKAPSEPAHGAPAKAEADKKSGPPLPVVEMPGPHSELTLTVRKMQRLQDLIAIGNRDAQLQQQKVLADVGGLIRDLGSTICMTRENRRALIIATLNGGTPAWVRACLADKTLSEQDRHLLRGAVAYSIGRTQNALEEFQTIDPLTLDPSLAAQVALVRASLTLPVDRALGLRFLDIARLLQPGGLVEEAALRQETATLGTSGDTQKFALLSRQYIERFSKSVFSDNFIQGFVRGVIELGLAADDEHFAKLREVVDLLTPEAAASTYLLIARRGLLDGTYGATRRATAAALTLVSPNSSEASRANLYRFAAAVTGTEGLQMQKKLQAMDANAFQPRDQKLRDAALKIADGIRKPPLANTTKGVEATAAQPETPIVKKAFQTLALAQTMVEAP